MSKKGGTFGAFCVAVTLIVSMCFAFLPNRVPSDGDHTGSASLPRLAQGELGRRAGNSVKTLESLPCKFVKQYGCRGKLSKAKSILDNSRTLMF